MILKSLGAVDGLLEDSRAINTPYYTQRVNKVKDTLKMDGRYAGVPKTKSAGRGRLFKKARLPSASCQ